MQYRSVNSKSYELTDFYYDPTTDCYITRVSTYTSYGKLLNSSQTTMSREQYKQTPNYIAKANREEKLKRQEEAKQEQIRLAKERKKIELKLKEEKEQAEAIKRQLEKEKKAVKGKARAD